MSASSRENSTAFPPEYLYERNDPQKLKDASIAFIVLPTIVFTLFVISRAFCANRNTWETWVLYPVAFIATLSNSILCLVIALTGGSGRRTAYLLLFAKDTLSLYQKLRTAVEFLYVLGAALPKVALLFLYIRMFPDRKIQILSWITLAVVILHFLTTGVIVSFTICQPFSYKWDQTGEGKCGDVLLVYKFYGIPNIITDVAILLIPLPILLRLRMGKIEKIGIILTFLTGSLGLITAIIRLVEFYATDLSDRTFNGTNTLTWTAVEPGAYFISSCFPGLRALIGTIHKKLRPETTHRDPAKFRMHETYDSDIPVRLSNGTSVAAT
ncbi:hypothetical protein NUW58_g650 [Xylaria curta]|uniref:Uncharacterized protein n=1 Tax=Xylaria curta TaxID=42375 RepID=A0ACC1PQH3_9PEZI|nr:hypothetical protein NUW58_g650 [Xylaria curta]